MCYDLWCAESGVLRQSTAEGGAKGSASAASSVSQALVVGAAAAAAAAAAAQAQGQAATPSVPAAMSVAAVEYKTLLFNDLVWKPLPHHLISDSISCVVWCVVCGVWCVVDCVVHNARR
jgi:hypothetical protein